ncbi:class I SAM-dependent methyltransferase [Pseudotenacibaculum sp. MALMAid0570]|uniref:class I SAM-dependent methyltransferase n=1 Tax=Pseudotenacibaculum sp. MALMAid0570 TaxID=3143938 RepID=UPI0032DE98C5
MDLLLKQVNKEDKIFDIGCGSGQFLLVVAEFVKAKKYFGIEITDTLITNANNLFSKYQKNANYQFLKYDGEFIPQEITDYNKVYMNDVLHHIPKDKQEQFIETLYNSLASSTTFILKDMDAASILVYFNKLHDLVFSQEIGNEISMKKACELLESKGFIISKQYRKRIFWYSHYIIVCKKN